jgi:hypothetical protein
MPRKTIFDMQFNMLASGSFVPIPGGLQIPFTLVGTHNNDLLIGTSRHDVINGLGGDDSIYGENGNDWLVGGRGDDHLDGGYGNDHHYGEDGDDYLNAGWGNDTLHGGIGNDAGWGDLGDDVIYGEAGNDVFGGAEGNDFIDGGAGNDDLEGGPGQDTIYGGAGNDILDDMTEFDGSYAENWFYGGDGDDWLVAAGVEGALAMNIIDGGAGFDILQLVPVGDLISNIGSLAGVTEGIEAIGMSYALYTTLIVNPQDVLDFSDNHALAITGGHDSKYFPISNSVDSTTGGWTVGGTVQAFGNEFQHYQATVGGQQVDLYVDTWLPQLGIML